ncbi:MAG: B12-binding domain-containing radical SAM protein [Planctomycetes bacterium]|nr:B12-binding domain-containing radical SAM protein [Planctomycetota bacterium]
MMKKIQLFFAPHDKEDLNPTNALPNLGLLILANCLKSAFRKSVKIEITDGAIIDYPTMVGKIDPEASFYGFNMRGYNAQNTLKLVSKAKKANPKGTVILGGIHATHLYREILSGGLEADIIVRSDGEEAIVEIVKGTAFPDIPNIAYRYKTGEIHTNELKQVDIRNFPPLDYSFVNPEDYFKIQSLESRRIRMLATFSMRGCINQIGMNKKCSFCCVKDKGLRLRKPEIAVEERKLLSKKWGVNLIRDVSGNIFSSPSWLEKYRKKILEGETNYVKYVVSCEAEMINKKNISLLKDIGTAVAYVGFTSNDAEVLKLANKKSTPEDNKKATRLLNESGLYSNSYLILGLEGETEESLQKNYDFASKISEYPKSKFYVKLLEIDPGSGCFEKLMAHPEIKRKYQGQYIFDQEKLFSDWAALFCRTDKKTILDYHEKIRKFAFRRKAEIEF